MLVPWDFQEAAIQSIFLYFKKKTGNPIVALPTGCHEKGHPILMYDGTLKKVEDIMIGDIIMGPDSLPRYVLNLARGKQEMRRIIPVRGESFVVNLDHKLNITKVKEGTKSSCYSEYNETITLREYENGSNNYRHLRKLRRVPIQFTEKKQPLPPYFIGLMLGDGSLTNLTFNLTTADKELGEYFSSIINSFNLTTRISDNGSKAKSYHAVGIKGKENPITAIFRELDMQEKRAWNKAIPDVYKLGNWQQRSELLAGLWDADGYIGKNNGAEYCTTSKQLAVDILFVAHSLGLGATCKEFQSKLYGIEKRKAYRVHLSGDFSFLPFKRLKHLTVACKTNRNPLVTAFTLEKLPESDYYGFELTGDHLYVDGYFNVHHNTGKSIVLTEFIRRALIKYPGTRILKLTHVKELIEQNFETLKKLWPNAPAGIYSSGLSKKQLGLPITFGGVQSIIKADMHSLGRIDLLIIDECHLVSPKDSTTYQKIIAKLKAVNPYLKVIGFTATQYRLGDGLLIDQEDGLFTDTCFDITHLEGFNWLLKNAYLSPLIPKKTQTQIDLTGVHKSGGDFKLNELQGAVDKEEITRNALLEMIEYGQDRDHWLIFSTGIEHAENISNMLNDFGLASTFIHSKLPDSERDKRLLDYKAGKFKAMVNNGILTTGFNFPSIDLIGVLRPTESASLWVQLLGRGTRPVFSPGHDLSTVEGRKMAIQASPKKNCLVMDFANNTHRLGPINDPVIPKKRGKGGNGMAPVKLCPQCATYNHASARFCIGCGEEFIAQVKIRSEAGTAELIRKEKEKPVHEIFKVDRVTYAKHIKHSTGSESLKVSYFCGMRMFTEWIQINNPGSRSKRWLSIRLGNHPIPTDIDDAMECLPFFKVPIYIKVEIVKNGYDNVLSYDFTGTTFNQENKK